MEATVLKIIEMGFEREQVVNAMRAFPDPDWAVEYLISGPPGLSAASGQGAAGGGGGGAGGRGGGGDAGEAARKEVAEDLVPMHHDAGDAGSGGGADSSDAHDIKPVADISENGQEVGPSQCSQKPRNAAGLVYARKHNLCRRLVVAPVAQGSPARGAGQSPSRSESANVPVSADADHEDGETDIDIAAAAAERMGARAQEKCKKEHAKSNNGEFQDAPVVVGREGVAGSWAAAQIEEDGCATVGITDQGKKRAWKRWCPAEEANDPKAQRLALLHEREHVLMAEIAAAKEALATRAVAKEAPAREGEHDDVGARAKRKDVEREPAGEDWNAIVQVPAYLYTERERVRERARET